MKEVPFPVLRARRRAAKKPKASQETAAPWPAPDPFHISVEERRRTLLRARPVLFWSGGLPPA